MADERRGYDDAIFRPSENPERTVITVRHKFAHMLYLGDVAGE
ncbi:MAG: hypothetical protein ABWY93_06710 [Mycobacterium sp.]